MDYDDEEEPIFTSDCGGKMSKVDMLENQFFDSDYDEFFDDDFDDGFDD